MIQILSLSPVFSDSLGGQRWDRGCVKAWQKSNASRACCSPL